MRRAMPLLVALIAMALYASTAARTVQGGDTGEFALVAIGGGVPHPPGYPVWCLAGRLFSLLPVGEFFRASLVSVVAGAACTGVVARIGSRLTASAVAGPVTGLAFAVSPLAWTLAGIPEAFALAALAAACVLLLAIRFAETPTTGRGLALGCGWGFAITCHLTCLFLAPIVIGVFLRERRPWRAVLAAAAGSAVGLTPFLLLPFLAGGSWTWGSPHTAAGLLRHVLRTDYGTFSLTPSGAPPRPLANIGEALVAYPPDMGAVLFIMIIPGAVLAWKKRRAATLTLLASVALAGLVLPTLSSLPDTAIAREVASRFRLLPIVLCTPFAAFAIAEVERRFRHARLVVFAPLPFAALVAFDEADWRHDRFVEAWARSAVSAIEPGAVLFGEGDLETFALLWVLRGRDDVRYYDVNLLHYRWYWERAAIPESVSFDPERVPLQALIDTLHAQGRAVHVTPTVAQYVGSRTVVPDGLLARVLAPTELRAPGALIETRLSAETALLPDDEPADAWSLAAREKAAKPWRVLAAAYPECADRCRARAAALIAPRVERRSNRRTHSQ